MNEINTLTEKSYRASNKWGYITIALGILAILLPMVVGVALVMIFASVLVITGLVQLAVPFPNEAKVVRLFLAYATLLTGILILFLPQIGLASLTLFVVVYLMLDALANFAAAWRLNPNPAWKHIAFAGVSSLVLAIIILWQWPTSSEMVIGILIGVKLISLGIMFLIFGKSFKTLSFENITK